MAIPDAIRKSSLLNNTLLILIGFTFMLTWLPLLRCLFDGKSYSWGTFYFGNNLRSIGLQPDYLFLVLSAVVFFSLFYGVYRMRNRKLLYGLLVIWIIHIFGNFLFEIGMEGDVMFHGDTLGVKVSLLAIVLPLAVLSLVMIGLFIIRDTKAEAVSISWSRFNTIKAMVMLGPLPLQAIFFAIGEPHDITDQMAVIWAIIQAILMGWIFAPGKDVDQTAS